ncbi:hypothetical protein LVJ94_26930 [Pendulispora rubella]|uniref:DUF4384 domain-containing protein n=1 Tax=Pendulispora rubella TaxID=2741070 RepID=A0ABZ2KPV0_9BACT
MPRSLLLLAPLLAACARPPAAMPKGTLTEREYTALHDRVRAENTRRVAEAKERIRALGYISAADEELSVGFESYRCTDSSSRLQGADIPIYAEVRPMTVTLRRRGAPSMEFEVNAGRVCDFFNDKAFSLRVVKPDGTGASIYKLPLHAQLMRDRNQRLVEVYIVPHTVSRRVPVARTRCYRGHGMPHVAPSPLETVPMRRFLLLPSPDLPRVQFGVDHEELLEEDVEAACTEYVDIPS